MKKTVVDSAIGITDSYTNKSGKTIIVCNSVEDRDSLKSVVSEKIPNIVTESPESIRPSIVIVGFSNTFTDDITETLINQNNCLKHFFAIYARDEHIKFISTKPLKSNSFLHQSYFSVSKELRDFLAKYNNKVVIGLKCCKIYERLYVKRCYKCQKYGHYISQCPTTSITNCGRCAGNHQISDCTITHEQSNQHSCINCKEINKPHNHLVSSSNCPVFIEEQHKIKKLIDNLN